MGKSGSFSVILHFHNVLQAPVEIKEKFILTSIVSLKVSKYIFRMYSLTINYSTRSADYFNLYQLGQNGSPFT